MIKLSKLLAEIKPVRNSNLDFDNARIVRVEYNPQQNPNYVSKNNGDEDYDDYTASFFSTSFPVSDLIDLGSYLTLIPSGHGPMYLFPKKYFNMDYKSLLSIDKIDPDHIEHLKMQYDDKNFKFIK